MHSIDALIRCCFTKICFYYIYYSLALSQNQTLTNLFNLFFKFIFHFMLLCTFTLYLLYFLLHSVYLSKLSVTLLTKHTIILQNMIRCYRLNYSKKYSQLALCQPAITLKYCLLIKKSVMAY